MCLSRCGWGMRDRFEDSLEVDQGRLWSRIEGFGGAFLLLFLLLLLTRFDVLGSRYCI